MFTKEYKRINPLKKFFGCIFIAFFLLVFPVFPSSNCTVSAATPSLWPIQSIDTMKTSRDLAREKLHDTSFDKNIRKELQLIKDSGARFVALDTPYDDEFIPYLSRWVKTARETGLSVWFRGNFSAWEGWFNYPKNMTREKHLAATKNFILSHPELFEDGDSFTSCPECEYGGSGNPLQTRDFEGFRKFMTDEYKVMNESFATIGKKVNTNWFSMNPDVAREVLDKNTVETIGNLITLDYYVKDSAQMKNGLDFFVKKFPEAKILLGEFGAPIPDINGDMTEREQENFVWNIFTSLNLRKNFSGVNYWVSFGGSTALFTTQLEPKKVTGAIEDFFIPGTISGTITNTLGDKLKDIPVKTAGSENTINTNNEGYYSLTVPAGTAELVFGGNKYKTISQNLTINRDTEMTNDVVLEPEHIGIIYRIRFILLQHFRI